MDSKSASPKHRRMVLRQQQRPALAEFGERLRAVRLALGLSQEALADLAGFDRTYVSLVERGRRNISLLNICKFAKALKTTAAELVRDL
ncbi:MAG TPA: helix-turn-helix transcriptional regulator [Terriglobia bacterium]|nr:helix-turn-helix transcriptional regulator [Terriglobia bacterium]